MKSFFRSLIGGLSIFWSAGFGFGQIVIPDAGFESWVSPGLYEEPSSSWWTSLNPLRQLGGPVTVSKSTDAHSGNFAAEMVTSSYGSLLVPGLLLSGEFDAGAPPTFLLQGKPWTSQPQKIQGWYKYFPAGGDSAAVVCQLTHWDGTQRVLVSQAALVIHDTVDAYTYFDLPFDIYSQDAPDSILLVLVASAEGQNFQGQVGSRLLVDDLALDFTTSLPTPSDPRAQVWPNPASQSLHVFTPGPAQIEIWDHCGKRLHSSSTDGGSMVLNTQAFSEGLYWLKLIYPEGNEIKKIQILR